MCLGSRLVIRGPSEFFFFFFLGGGGLGGNIASAEGTKFVGGSGGILPHKIFKFEGSEALFSATFQEMCPKNRPRI